MVVGPWRLRAETARGSRGSAVWNNFRVANSRPEGPQNGVRYARGRASRCTNECTPTVAETHRGWRAASEDFTIGAEGEDYTSWAILISSGMKCGRIVIKL